MRKKLLVLSVLIIAFAVTIVPTFSQQQSEVCSGSDVTVNIGNGCIDYTTGWIYATGQGEINDRQSMRDAIRTAQVTAQQNMMATIKGMTIDFNTETNRELKEDSIKSFAKHYIKGIQTVGKPDFLSVGGKVYEKVIVVTVRLPLRLTEDMFPQQSLQPSQQPRQQPAAPEQPSPQQAQEPSIYSGVIINATNLRIRPAMAPKIVDEDGREVYGSAYVNRDFAIREGMAGYTKSINEAESNTRVASSPLEVKGIKTADSNNIDIVISNEDARKIRNASSYQKFLDECRVMIVLKEIA